MSEGHRVETTKIPEDARKLLTGALSELGNLEIATPEARTAIKNLNVLTAYTLALTVAEEDKVKDDLKLKREVIMFGLHLTYSTEQLMWMASLLRNVASSISELNEDTVDDEAVSLAKFVAAHTIRLLLTRPDMDELNHTWIDIMMNGN